MALHAPIEGGCHCADITYVYTPTQPLKEMRAIDCDCSICSINGYLLIYPQPEEVAWTNKDHLQSYSFNTHSVLHCFCPRCGTSVMVEPEDPNSFPVPGMKLALNVRTMRDVGIESFEWTRVNQDGKAEIAARQRGEE